MQKEVPFSKARSQRYPEQVAIAIAKEKSGRCNPITVSWTMLTSHDPPMMAVSIGLTRHSFGVFRDAEEFVIALPTERQADEAMLFGTKSGRDCDKLAEAGTKLVPAKKVDCVLMADAVANFECVKRAELRTGDHAIFVGEVVCAHIDPEKPARLFTVGPGYQMAGLPRGKTP